MTDNLTDPFPSTRPQELEPPDAPAGTSVRAAATEKSREMKMPGRRCRVVLDGAEPYEVRVDNRDFLRWDKTAPRHKWGAGRDVPFLMATFLAWSASTRAGLTTLTFPQFEDAAVEVEELTEDDSDLARPTR
jgi:hypothetical protein